MTFFISNDPDLSRISQVVKKFNFSLSVLFSNKQSKNTIYMSPIWAYSVKGINLNHKGFFPRVF